LNINKLQVLVLHNHGVQTVYRFKFPFLFKAPFPLRGPVLKIADSLTFRRSNLLVQRNAESLLRSPRALRCTP